jgi:hypothetical protein
MSFPSSSSCFSFFTSSQMQFSKESVSAMQDGRLVAVSRSFTVVCPASSELRTVNSLLRIASCILRTVVCTALLGLWMARSPYAVFFCSVVRNLAAPCVVYFEDAVSSHLVLCTMRVLLHRVLCSLGRNNIRCVLWTVHHLLCPLNGSCYTFCRVLWIAISPHHVLCTLRVQSRCTLCCVR